MKILDTSGAYALDYNPFEAVLHRADPAMRVRGGFTPLHIAVVHAGTGCVRGLIGRGADTEATNDHGWTPLHVAAAVGDREMIKFLLEVGANPGARCEDGKTPMEMLDV